MLIRQLKARSPFANDDVLTGDDLHGRMARDRGIVSCPHRVPEHPAGRDDRGRHSEPERHRRPGRTTPSTPVEEESETQQNAPEQYEECEILRVCGKEQLWEIGAPSDRKNPEERDESPRKRDRK